MALNRARVVADITITGNMSYQVQVEFFDSAATSVVLWAETFIVPPNATTTQLQNIIVARGQEVRAGLAAQAAARVSVPNGTVVTVT